MLDIDDDQGGVPRRCDLIEFCEDFDSPKIFIAVPPGRCEHDYTSITSDGGM